MATRYSRNNSMDDDTIVEGTLGGGRERIPAGDDDDYRSTIAGIAEDLIRMKKKHQQSLAEAVHRSLQKRVAKAKYNNPAGSKIQVRREGLLARQNSQDRQRFEAAKANKDRATLNALLAKAQGDYFASGKKYVMDVLQYVSEMDADLPEELQPIGLALSKFINEALTGTFAEGGTMIGEFGLEEIALATKPPRDEERSR